MGYAQNYGLNIRRHISLKLFQKKRVDYSLSFFINYKNIHPICCLEKISWYGIIYMYIYYNLL